MKLMFSDDVASKSKVVKAWPTATNSSKCLRRPLISLIDGRKLNVVVVVRINDTKDWAKPIRTTTMSRGGDGKGSEGRPNDDDVRNLKRMGMGGYYIRCVTGRSSVDADGGIRRSELTLVG